MRAMWNVTLTKRPLGRSKHLTPQVQLFALSATESRWAPICKTEGCFHGRGSLCPTKLTVKGAAPLIQSIFSTSFKQKSP